MSNYLDGRIEEAGIARMTRILKRHIPKGVMSDDAFIREIFRRYEVDRGRPLIDPNE